MELSRRYFLYSSGLMAMAINGGFGSIRSLLKRTKGKRAPLRRENPYVKDGRSLVAVAGGNDVDKAMKEAVSLIGGLEKLDIKGKTVLVKPNVVNGKENPTTTSPAVVGAVVRLLYEAGAKKVYVGDMSALMHLDTKRNMERTGIKKVAEEAGAEAVFFEDHEWVSVDLPGGKYIKKVGVTEWMFKVDRIVNLPVIKTHRSASYSICLKNFIGATHARQRPYFVDGEHWEEVVSEINLAYSPDINIVDGTRAMVAGGPWEGPVEETDLIIASGDRVAADIVGLAVIKSFGMQKDIASKGVWEQRQIRRAVELGMGAKGIDEIELVTASLDKGREFEELMVRVKAAIV